MLEMIRHEEVNQEKKKRKKWKGAFRISSVIIVLAIVFYLVWLTYVSNTSTINTAKQNIVISFNLSKTTVNVNETFVVTISSTWRGTDKCALSVYETPAPGAIAPLI